MARYRKPLIIPWPEDGSCADFETLVRGVRDALTFNYRLTRRNRTKDTPYHGHQIGDLHVCMPVEQMLTAESLAYQKTDQGRDALESILGIAVQLGIEQGRRDERQKHDARRMYIDMIRRLNTNADIERLLAML